MKIKKRTMVFAIISLIVLALVICACTLSAKSNEAESTATSTPVIVPSDTELPTVTITPDPTATDTPEPTNTQLPTETPTMTIVSDYNPDYYHYTPTGMSCEIEPQWNQVAGHDVKYGCFAVSCFMANGSVVGDNLLCMDGSGTPWPYDWKPYHPLMDTLQ